MATVGQVLTTPEDGWIRVDGGSSSVIKTGTWTTTSNAAYYSGIDHYTSTQGSSFSFSFYGTAFRIIDQRASNRSTNTSITIDGSSETVNFSQANDANQTVIYEKLNLPASKHIVTVTKNDATSTSALLSVDAIDIIGAFTTIAVGQVLTAPESGWKRYDDAFSAIQKVGSGWSSTANASHYSGAAFATASIADSVKFYFTGTKLRLISYVNTGTLPSKVNITIDGVIESFSENMATAQFQTLVYEKTNLSNVLHFVEIKGDTAGTQWALVLDAIDIDSNGEIRNPYNKFLISSNGEIKATRTRVSTDNTVIPIMASNTAPSGVASASSVYDTNYPAFKAFNGNESVFSNAWISVANATTGWLMYQFPSAKIISKYSITSRNDVWRGDLVAWTFEGSNNGSTWTTLDTRSAEPTWSQYEQRYYEISNSSAYTYYRLNISSVVKVGSATAITVGQLKMYDLVSQHRLYDLVSTDETTFIKYGMDKGNVVDLLKPCDSLVSPKSQTVALGTGKIFKTTLDTSKHLVKKASIQ